MIEERHNMHVFIEGDESLISPQYRLNRLKRATVEGQHEEHDSSKQQVDSIPKDTIPGEQNPKQNRRHLRPMRSTTQQQHKSETFNQIKEEDSNRSEERRVVKECVRTCRYRWSPNH